MVNSLIKAKSQGLEFNHVLLALPKNYNPVLCKALIYTGVTTGKTASNDYGKMGGF